MEIYATEEQQVQAIKDWWKKNGVSIIAGLVIGLAVVFGWRFYQSYQLEQKQAASSAYQSALDDYLTDPDQLGSAVDKLASGHYKSFAQLSLAKAFVEKQQYEEAAITLASIVANDDDPIRSFAALRLARVQGQLGQTDAALKTLEEITGVGFAATVATIRGDVLLQNGDVDGARTAYQAAIMAGAGNAQGSIQVKLDDLAELEVING